MSFISFSLLSLSIMITFQADARAAQADTVWIKTYGGPMTQEGISLRQTADGGYVIAGNADLGGSYPFYYMVRTDSAGNLCWDSIYKGDYILNAAAAEETSDGGFLLTGSESEMTVAYIYTIRTDQYGDPIWHRRHWGSSIAYTNCSSMIRTSGGYFALAGDHGGIYGCEAYFLVIDDDGTTIMETYPGEGALNCYTYQNCVSETSDGFMTGGRSNYWLPGAVALKLDGSGEDEWYGLPDYTGISDTYNGVLEMPDGSFIASGNHRDQNEDYDFFLSRFDCEGNLIFEECFGLPDRDELVRDMILTADGGILMAGIRYQYGYYSTDIYLVKLDAAGDFQWDCLMGGPGYDKAGEIMELEEDTYLMTGTINTGADGWDVLLMKFMVTDEGVAHQEDPSPGAPPEITCYPNPCTEGGYVTVSLSCGEAVSIDVFDLSGRLVAQPATVLAPGTHAINWNVTDDAGSSLPDGVYTLTARSSAGTTCRRLVVLR